MSDGILEYIAKHSGPQKPITEADLERFAETLNRPEYRRYGRTPYIMSPRKFRGYHWQAAQMSSEAGVPYLWEIS